MIEVRICTDGTEIGVELKRHPGHNTTKRCCALVCMEQLFGLFWERNTDFD